MVESTATMYCPVCKKCYVATVTIERFGAEVSGRYVSPCPDCGTPGQVPLTR